MTKQMIFDKPIATATFPFEPIGNSTMSAADALVPQSVTLTSDATNVSALESVSLGSYSGQVYVYTFVAALTVPAVPFEVKIGADAATTLDNLKAAVNLTGTPGDVWSTGTTIHPDIEATTNTNTTQVFAAKTAGYIGALSVTETSAHLSFGATSLSGAAGRIALASGTTLIVRNTGHKDAYIKLGSSTVEATTSDYPVPAGGAEVLYRDPAYTHLSAVCATGETTTLSVSTGVGTPLSTASNEVIIGDITLSNVEISNDVGNPVPVTGPLTDTQLRASDVKVSLDGESITVTGALTDTQLRATAVPVSGPITDTELRAADVKVTLDSEAVILGAGTATIGKLGANSGVDIGDVDVTSLPAHLGTVASNTAVVGVELTRPADTTAYTAKDVVSDSTSAPTVLTFANFARVNNGSGMIVRARLMTDQKTCTAGFRLHLFHTAPTATNDNSPYLLLYSNATNRIGMIDFPAMASEDSTNSTAAATMRPSSDGSYGTPNLWYQAAAASRAIYGVLETTSAFTPASGQKFYVELAAIND